MVQIVTEADILFPSAQYHINRITNDLRRADHSTKNRLHSIVHDADFVEKITDELGLPVIANERCGSWYIRPAKKAGSAYFKSTDGHNGQWSFSLRRLNLHLLETIQQGHGCIIVDSTRRGKSMPDALSKTIPIWIVILNRILFPDQVQNHQLHTPSNVVSASEHSQIQDELSGMLKGAMSLHLNIEELRSIIHQPLRPYWITPANPHIDISDQLTWPVVLCTASNRDSARLRDDVSYVQGAADDHESWSLGLTASLFWQHKEELLYCGEDSLPDKIAQIIASADKSPVYRMRSLISPTTQLLIASNASILQGCDDIDLVVYASADRDIGLEAQLKARGISCLHLACTGGKNGSRQLRSELTKLDSIAGIQPKSARILCSCTSGRDIAVGVALAVLCKFFAVDGSALTMQSASINKASIKQRLSWIIVSMPDAAPSRSTLQSVNTYLMS